MTRGPCTSVEDVELVTLGWVHRHGTTRVHGYLGDVPPLEHEAAFHAAPGNDHTEVDLPSLEPRREPGRLSECEVAAGVHHGVGARSRHG